MTSPEIVACCGLISPITVSELTLLPEPDSPTMPSVSPGSIEYDTPSTAFTTPSSVLKCTLRSLTSSSGLRHYVYLTLGSRNAYTTSTTRFAMAMKTAPSTVTPMTAGKSF